MPIQFNTMATAPNTTTWTTTWANNANSPTIYYYYDNYGNKIATSTAPPASEPKIPSLWEII